MTTDAQALEYRWHYRMINACIASGHIRAVTPQTAVVAGSTKVDAEIPEDSPGYLAIGLKAKPTCFLRGDRGINAGFVGETIDNYVVLAFRGTISSVETADSLAVCLDWSQDRLYEPKPWTLTDGTAYGKTCEGFTAAVTSVWDDIQAALGKINWAVKQGIWITGHSKGGAMAALVASRVRKLHTEDKFRPKVVTFGAPMVGDADFRKAYDAAGLMAQTARYQNQYDGVPLAPDVPTPPMPMPGCTAVLTQGDKVEGYGPLGLLRYISRDVFGLYSIEIDGAAEVNYAGSMAYAINHRELIGPAHNPTGNYLHCFPLHQG